MRLRVLVPLIALISASFALPAATLGQQLTTEPLGVYAGDSQVVLGWTSANVEATVFGGQAPVTYTWTIDGSSDRFTDPSDAGGSVDLAGLVGDVDIQVTVTDAAGETASDTVRYHRVPITTVLAVENTTGPAVPDETVGSTEDRQDHAFSVPPGTARIEATLAWDDNQPTLLSDDLDLVLLDPSDEEATGDEGRTPDHPETVSVDDPVPGTWTARVEPWAGEGTDYELTVEAFGGSGDVPDVPDAIPRGTGTFASLDDQVLHAEIRRADVAASTIAWDLDEDGVTDVTGQHPKIDLPVGEHPVAVTITDDEGLQHRRTTAVTVTDEAEHALGLKCAERIGWDHAAMEFSLSGETCWMHGGHHTYALDRAYTLASGEGKVVSVEQELSPPTEIDPTRFETPIHVETSMDGQTWTQIDVIDYTYYASFPASRNKIHATLDASDEPFRYVRFSEPQSAAQGLSGFLDNSVFIFLVDEAETPTPSPVVQDARASQSCLEGDILEDFFDTHPCWFGGINRYDAPSFSHTYELGRGSVLEQLDATVQVAPWRTDDFFIPIVVDEDTERMQAYAGQVTNTTVFVQTSPDGEAWTTIGSATALFGEPLNLDIEPDQPAPARFVRLTPDLHPSFDNHRAHPSLHHPEAFVTFSEITVQGLLPATP